MASIDVHRATVTIPPHIRSTIDADGGVVLDLERGAYLSLNKIGGRIWARLANGARPDAIAAELAASCNVQESRVRDDVARFLGELQEKGLVRIDIQ